MTPPCLRTHLLALIGTGVKNTAEDNSAPTHPATAEHHGTCRKAEAAARRALGRRGGAHRGHTTNKGVGQVPQTPGGDDRFSYGFGTQTAHRGHAKKAHRGVGRAPQTMFNTAYKGVGRAPQTPGGLTAQSREGAHDHGTQVVRAWRASNLGRTMDTQRRRSPRPPLLLRTS